MTFQTFTQELREFIYSSTGVMSALRCRETYFRKYHKIHLWDELHRRYPSTYTLRDKIVAAVQLQLEQIDLCVVCQQHPRMICPPYYSRYCSSSCSRHDTVKFQHVKQKRNETVASEKRKHTMIQKYGVEFNSQRTEIKPILQKPKLNPHAYTQLNNEAWLREQYLTLKRTSVDIAKELHCYYGTVIGYLRQYEIEIIPYRSTSQIETDIHTFLTTHQIAFTKNTRTLIPPFEIDVVIPDTKLAIEVNGLYWHSFDHPETKQEREKHLMKTERCLEKGYTCLHITDWEWEHQREIIESMILSRCQKTPHKYSARACLVHQITSADARSFLTHNHLQGFSGAQFHYGLYHHETLMSVLSIGKPRFSSHAEYEIIRFATQLHSTVRGGFGKLFHTFLHDHHPKSVITYADRRFGEGSVYHSQQFQRHASTSPGYCWTNGTDIKSRYQTQKHKLSTLGLTHYDPSWSESEVMFANRYRRLWDCGQSVWMWKKES